MLQLYRVPVAVERTRYYQESREGIYGGTSFVVANFIQSIPVSLVSTFLASFILFKGLKNELLCTQNPTSGERSCRPSSTYTAVELDTIERQDVPNWIEYSYYPDFVAYWLTLWACYLGWKSLKLSTRLYQAHHEFL